MWMRTFSLLGCLHARWSSENPLSGFMSRWTLGEPAKYPVRTGIRFPLPPQHTTGPNQPDY